MPETQKVYCPLSSGGRNIEIFYLSKSGYSIEILHYIIRVLHSVKVIILRISNKSNPLCDNIHGLFFIRQLPYNVFTFCNYHNIVFIVSSGVHRS